MNQETVQALHRINRDFYRRCAAEFSASRRRPWPGWERALAAYEAYALIVPDDPQVDIWIADIRNRLGAGP